MDEYINQASITGMETALRVIKDCGSLDEAIAVLKDFIQEEKDEFTE